MSESSPNLMRVMLNRWLLLVETFTLVGTGQLFGAIPANEEHGLSQQAVDIARPFGLPITNSMVVTWTVALILIIFARLATRNMKAVPDAAQTQGALPDRQPASPPASFR